MRKKRKMDMRVILGYFRGLTVILFVVICRCSDIGTGSSTETALIKGSIYTDSGPAVNVAIKVYPADFLPWIPAVSITGEAGNPSGTPFTFFTNDHGEYEIPLPDSGIYNIIGQADDTLGVYIDSIQVQGGGDVHVHPDTLRLTAQIHGVLHMVGQNDTNQIRASIYIPGSKWITRPEIGGAFAIKGVPKGRYTIIISPDLDDYNIRVIDVSVKAGDQLQLDTIRLTSNDEANILFRDTSRTLTVTAGAIWSKIGITVSMGNVLVITSSGTVVSERNGEFGPDGGSAVGGLSYLLVNQPIYAFYARIGGGAAFKIGSSYYGLAQSGGELEFAINSMTGETISGKYVIDSLVVRKK
jgi:hypothetical protein